MKRLVVGRPIASSEEHHHRLIKVVALAVFASDAISSTAYATEEILHVLVPVEGMAGLDRLIPIALIVMGLLAIVVLSYRQTIHAYPSGGGSYVVSRENLGAKASLVAGASLLVDYILTVAVSITAGVAAITSAYPDTRQYRVEICIALLAVMTIANLRGTKESGTIFAGPTYGYIVMLGLLLAVGLSRSFLGDLDPLPVNQEALDEAMGGGVAQAAGLLLLARAFSSGAVALTGVEAISNGVPAFRAPESRNAARTLVWMAGILGVGFLGISVLAHRLGPTVSEDETVLSQLGGAVFGRGSVAYYALQFTTFAILILAANTAFADFPRVSSIIASDGYLPRQLANRGDRLVFSNGILVLAAVAGTLIVAFGGITTALIPLYAVGVFTGFTLSQSGMVVHHRSHQGRGWRGHMVVNGIGAAATALVALVVVGSKFRQGAWIPAALIPLIVLGFLRIRHHYEHVQTQLSVPEAYDARRREHTVVVLVGRVHRGVLDAISYARSLAPERIIAATVVYDEQQQREIEKQWDEFAIPVELRTIYSPYRDLTGPILRLVDELDDEWPDDVITVVVPEFVLQHWWQQLLHNQSALMLKARLRGRPNTVVTAVPVQIPSR
jgi:amino acid transporter